MEDTRHDPPANLPQLIRDRLQIDVSARYAGASIPHPFGKASGQLSQTLTQVEADISAGLAFIVLKTVVAEDPSGDRTMDAWAIPVSRMQIERRQSASGRSGWTVTWRGRGWPGTLADYARFLTAALERAMPHGVPVTPSVKYHLPGPSEPVRQDEYVHTTERLLEAWQKAGCTNRMLIEKDFSPTLAGDQRARNRTQVLEWVKLVPSWVYAAVRDRTRLSIKLLNGMFDDSFQAELLAVASRSSPPPSHLTVFNRLFDPARGIAFGGWDLSDRNLRALDTARMTGIRLPPLSATGNICSGRMMVEYARRGCENGQLHTFFQLPTSEYLARSGSRSARVLHTLLLHPEEGLTVWLRHLHETDAIVTGDPIRFLDVVRSGRSSGPAGATKPTE